ncbi:MAG: hypothetical protein PHQ86_08805 [Dehalococcoidales bacterium]|nr:hypothetical protein [Dehalococcoidales bacterium]
MDKGFYSSDQISAEAKLKKYEEAIKKLSQGDPLQKTLKHMMIPWKLEASLWMKNPECLKKSLQITINMVHRNEQINIAAVCAGHQIIMCDNEMVNLNNQDYYLLVPMQGIETPFGVYERNGFGKDFQTIVENKWGKKLDKFPCKYVAQVYRRPLLANNVLQFWEELEQKGLFDFWDPKGGPVKWCRDHPNPHLPILRVFEIDRDLRSVIDYRKVPGFPPFLTGIGIRAKATPVLTDEEFEQQCNSLLDIFKKPKYKLQY